MARLNIHLVAVVAYCVIGVTVFMLLTGLCASTSEGQKKVKPANVTLMVPPPPVTPDSFTYGNSINALGIPAGANFNVRILVKIYPTSRIDNCVRQNGVSNTGVPSSGAVLSTRN